MPFNTQRKLIEGIDITTPNGRLIFHLIGALAQFERELIRERNDHRFGRRQSWRSKGGQPLERNAEKLRVAQRLLINPTSTISEVARTFGVHRTNLHEAKQNGGAATLASQRSRPSGRDE